MSTPPVEHVLHGEHGNLSEATGDQLERIEVSSWDEAHELICREITRGEIVLVLKERG